MEQKKKNLQLAIGLIRIYTFGHDKFESKIYR